jgi:lipid A 3-O-deacylase
MRILAYGSRGAVVTLFFLSLCLLACPARAQDQQNRPLGGIVDEVKLGVLAHDIDLFAANPKENGVAINTEILFVNLPFADPERPAWLNFILTPRPAIGGSISTNGGTSFGYFGANWEVTYARRIINPNDSLFGSFEFGAAFNDAPSSGFHPDREVMGSTADFHLAAELGYRFDKHFSASLYYEHISNADLASPNPGINNAGVRFGYKF